MRSLTSAVSGMEQFQQEMDVIGNNIANVNTVAFKSSHDDLADSFSQTLDQVGQIGLGVTTEKIAEDFAQGAISQTGVLTDLAVNGNGFFQVKDPVSGQEYVTRAGNFEVDQNGYLVTDTGQRVQGYNDLGLSAIGDIQIDAAVRPSGASSTATMTGFSIESDGTIEVSMSDGTEYTRGQDLDAEFLHAGCLGKCGQQPLYRDRCCGTDRWRQRANPGGVRYKRTRKYPSRVAGAIQRRSLH